MAFEAKSNYELKSQIHIGSGQWHRRDGVFRFLSGTGIDCDYDYDTGDTANKNKINTIPYEPRRDAEDSDGDTVTDAIKSLCVSLERLMPFLGVLVATLLQVF